VTEHNLSVNIGASTKCFILAMKWLTLTLPTVPYDFFRSVIILLDHLYLLYDGEYTIIDGGIAVENEFA